MDAERLERWVSPRRILVATNLEDESVLAWEAASQAHDSGAKILLVHVIEPPFPRPSRKRDAPMPDSPRDAAWNMLLHISRMIEWEGAACEPVLLEGDPAPKIAELAQERAVDRVIVATRSARGLNRLMGGSVAEALLESLDVPVCLIGPRAMANPFRGSRGGQVLVTLSLHHDRLDDLRFASLLSVRRQSALTVMHALDSNGMGKAYKNVARGAAHASIVVLTSRIPEPLPELRIVIREGSPTQEILDEDVCPGCAFIVMGSSSPGLVSQLMGSGVLHRVIAEARCPVIALPRERRRDAMAQHFPIADGERHDTAA